MIYDCRRTSWVESLAQKCRRLAQENSAYLYLCMHPTNKKSLNSTLFISKKLAVKFAINNLSEQAMLCRYRNPSRLSGGTVRYRAVPFQPTPTKQERGGGRGEGEGGGKRGNERGRGRARSQEGFRTPSPQRGAPVSFRPCFLRFF